MDRLLFPLAAALACGVAPVHAAYAAADGASDDDAAERAEPIVIIGRQLKYDVRSTSTATKTNTDVKDIPHALMAITCQHIEAQQLHSVGERLMYVPGASYDGGECHRDQIVLRGNSKTAEFF